MLISLAVLNWVATVKQTHRVLLNYKMKIKDSDLCLYCGSKETLQHLLVSCPSLRTFWSDVLTWRNSSSTCNILFDELKILYGYNAGDPRCLLLNYYILIAKFHIFRHKIDSKSPTFPAFMTLLKERLLVYKAAVVANKTLQKFQTRWKTLLPLLDSKSTLAYSPRPPCTKAQGVTAGQHF